MHSTVLVVIRHDNGNTEGPTFGIEGALDELLAPFDENLEVEQYTEDGETYWRNPQGYWDWWTLGGRWAGYLTLRPGVTPLAGAYGTTGVMNSCRTADDGVHVSMALKATIDFERMAHEQVEALRKGYAEAAADPRAWHGDIDLGATEDEHVRANLGFACRHLVLDGKWHSRELADYSDKPFKEWVAEFNSLLASVADNDVCCVVDVHT